MSLNIYSHDEEEEMINDDEEVEQQLEEEESDEEQEEEGEDEEQESDEEGEQEEGEEDQEEEESEEEEEEEVQSSSLHINGSSVDNQPHKRRKVSKDRISQLPEALLVHILSLMPTKYAVRTSLLSKRWQHIWTSTSTLVYEFDGTSKDWAKFAMFVYTTLILHKSPKICKFVMRANHYSFKDSMKLWLHSAVIKNVEEIIVKCKSGGSYKLPSSFYSCESLTRLSLSCCSVLNPGPSTVNWRSLKHLSLRNMKLEDTVIQRVLIGSPLLESLKLKRCYFVTRINITSEKLRRLVINGHSDRDGGWLDIDAPHLCSLEIMGYSAVKKYRLKNVKSLVHASFTFSMKFWGDLGSDSNDDEPNLRIREHTDVVRTLMDAVRHVENLTLATWMVQVLSYYEVEGVPCLMSSRKSLILKIGLLPYDLPGIEGLLRTSPSLERLVIDTSQSYLHQKLVNCKELRGLNYETNWLQKNEVYYRPRTVEIIGFWHHVTQLSKFLLQNAKSLEKIILRSIRSHSCFGGDFFGILVKLLSFPRSSPEAQVLLLPKC